ncbi:MAG: hypothetical protein WC312_03760 [Candidatus Omnitrophota bacterium]|jgi:hypothetical protein
MNINWQGIFAFLVVVWLWVKRIISELEKIIEPLAEKAEKYAQDGLIDKADRHALVTEAITLLEHRKIIKLNPISRFLVTFVIKKVAAKLPDFKVEKEAGNVISQLAKKS